MASGTSTIFIADYGTDNPVLIGHGWRESHNFTTFSASYDEVNIYNYALSEAEIGVEYQAVSQPLDSDGDGLTDAEEADNINTNPLDPDTDGDGVVDGTDGAPLLRTLSGDHAGGITIDSDGVTLDCADYKVMGPGVVGVLLAGGSQGVTVENCHITGFDTATHVDSIYSNGWLKFAQDNRFENNTVDNSSVGGINLSNSSSSFVIDNIINHTGWGCGISLYRSGSNTVEGNEISGGTDGVCLADSSGNTVAVNHVANGTGDGFRLSGSINNSLDRNSATSYARSGITLGANQPNLTTGNIVTANTLTGNGTGILLAEGVFNNLPDLQQL